MAPLMIMARHQYIIGMVFENLKSKFEMKGKRTLGRFEGQGRLGLSRQLRLELGCKAVSTGKQPFSATIWGKESLVALDKDDFAEDLWGDCRWIRIRSKIAAEHKAPVAALFGALRLRSIPLGVTEGSLLF